MVDKFENNYNFLLLLIIDPFGRMQSQIWIHPGCVFRKGPGILSVLRQFLFEIVPKYLSEWFLFILKYSIRMCNIIMQRRQWYRFNLQMNGFLQFLPRKSTCINERSYPLKYIRIFRTWKLMIISLRRHIAHEQPLEEGNNVKPLKWPRNCA